MWPVNMMAGTVMATSPRAENRIINMRLDTILCKVLEVNRIKGEVEAGL